MVLVPVPAVLEAGPARKQARRQPEVDGPEDVRAPQRGQERHAREASQQSAASAGPLDGLGQRRPADDDGDPGSVAVWLAAPADGGA